MRSIVESIFGVYVPVTTPVYDAEGAFLYDAVAEGAAGVDWTYVLGVALFGIVLYCALRMIEAVIRSV